jgi:hypothetical protein
MGFILSFNYLIIHPNYMNKNTCALYYKDQEYNTGNKQQQRLEKDIKIHCHAYPKRQPYGLSTLCRK